MLRGTFFIAIMLLSSCRTDGMQANRSSADIGDFSRFREVKNIKPESHAFVLDPAGSGEVVERFYIDGTSCQNEDCQFGSVRSAVGSNIWDDIRPRSVTSPRQAWYSFEIYFPENLPYGRNQHRGSYLLAEFKESNECGGFYFAHVNGHRDANLYLYLSRYTGRKDEQFNGAPNECLGYFEGKVGEMGSLLGRWNRFEYFVRWSENDDGLIEVYRDNELVLHRVGRNCENIENCRSRNIHYYGIYKPNNNPLSAVLPATVYYRNVSMAQSRENLTR